MDNWMAIKFIIPRPPFPNPYYQTTKALSTPIIYLFLIKALQIFWQILCYVKKVSITKFYPFHNFINYRRMENWMVSYDYLRHNLLTIDLWLLRIDKTS